MLLGAACRSARRTRRWRCFPRRARYVRFSARARAACSSPVGVRCECRELLALSALTGGRSCRWHLTCARCQPGSASRQVKRASLAVLWFPPSLSRTKYAFCATSAASFSASCIASLVLPKDARLRDCDSGDAGATPLDGEAGVAGTGHRAGDGVLMSCRKQGHREFRIGSYGMPRGVCGIFASPE